MDVEYIGIDASIANTFPPEALVEYLDDIGPEVEIVDGTPDSLAPCDAVVTLEHRDAFVGAVGWIHSIQAGVDRFPFEVLESEGIVLTNSTGIHGESIGETVAGYMAMFARGLHVAVENQQDHVWDRPGWDELFTLGGESVCVVGTGSLGRGIVESANGLGMHVTGVRRTPEPVEGVERMYGPDELHDAIADARFVAITVPLNDETYHLIGPDELDAMREDAYLVNVARGSVVDEPALIDALREGAIAGAALDVFEEEPLPADSPLWELDEVIVTPHQAGVWDGYYRAIGDLVRENVRRLDAGEEWMNRVL